MTTIAPQLPASDADLIAAARSGDRSAFGQIVQRYQSLVSGLAYSACGNLHRSEDLAQETFLAAWKSLPSLRDPNKLPAWLCQITRHRLYDLARRNSAEKIHLNEAQQNNPAPPVESPDHPILLAEERELLWQTLAKIPQPYRDTMVLYYRQSQSTVAVAAALDITEDAVRQRLTRGREMLREQMAAVVERNLTRSAPDSAFSLAVLAALPATTAPLTAATAATLKSSAAAKASSLPLLLLWAGPLIALTGGLIATLTGIFSAPSRRHRNLALLNALLIWSLVAAIVIEQITLSSLTLTNPTYVLAQSISWCLYGILLTTVLLFINRRLLAISESDNPQPVSSNRKYLLIALSGTFAASGGSMSWLIRPALAANDPLAASLIITAILAIPLLVLLISHLAKKRWPHSPILVSQLSLFALITFIVTTLLLALHLRLHTWFAFLHNTSLTEIQNQFPLWSTDLASLLLILWTAALLLYAKKKTSR